MALTTKIIVANPGGVTSITDGSAAFPIAEGSYTTGLTRDGVRYVIAPNGITLNEPTPVQVNVSGREKNGAMINPERLAPFVLFQAFDNFGGNVSTFDLTKDASFPQLLRPGDCVVKAVSASAPTAGGREGVLDQFGALHIVASAPASNAFAAPFIWPSADKASRPWRVVDVDARLAELPSLSASGMSTITWAHLAQYWDRLELAQALTSATSAGGYEYCTLFQFSGNGAINYDRAQHNIFKAVCMGLMLNEWSTADKTAALIRLLQHGCQRGETIVKDNGTYPPYADGGHHRSQYMPAMTWLWGTGRQSEYATWVPLVGGSVREQVIKLDASFLTGCAIHSDTTKPYPWRRRNIISVSGSGPYTVVVEGYRAPDDLSGDGVNPGLVGLNMVRESDSATRAVLTCTGGGSGSDPMTITIASQPGSPFVATNTVYFPPPFSLVTDECDFILANSRPWTYNPSVDAAYRNLQHDAISHLWLHAIGMHGSLMANALSYSLRAMQSNNPSGYDLPSHADVYGPELHGRVGNETWEQQFYTAHSATLLALPQDV